MIDYNLKKYSGHYPVPADCPAFRRTMGKKDTHNPDYAPYLGKAEWCNKCPIHTTYCDGQICVETLPEKEEVS